MFHTLLLYKQSGKTKYFTFFCILYLCTKIFFIFIYSDCFCIYNSSLLLLYIQILIFSCTVCDSRVTILHIAKCTTLTNTVISHNFIKVNRYKKFILQDSRRRDGYKAYSSCPFRKRAPCCCGIHRACHRERTPG